MRSYKVIIGNSQDMREVQDRSIDLTVTSPPYFNILDYPKSVDGQIGEIKDKVIFFEEFRKVIKEVYRVTRAGGKLAIEVEDYPIGRETYGYVREICLLVDYVKAIEDTGFYLLSRWFRHKFDASKATRNVGAPVYGNLDTTEPRSITNLSYCFVYRKYSNVNEGKKLDFTRGEWIDWQDAVWEIPNHPNELYQNQATFPIELAKRFIRIYSNKGDTILDPFLGTGTTMRASYDLVRNCIGYEIRSSMLPIIKAKTGFGQQPITGEEVKWEAIER